MQLLYCNKEIKSIQFLWQPYWEAKWKPKQLASNIFFQKKNNDRSSLNFEISDRYSTKLTYCRSKFMVVLFNYNTVASLLWYCCNAMESEGGWRVHPTYPHLLRHWRIPSCWIVYHYLMRFSHLFWFPLFHGKQGKLCIRNKKLHNKNRPNLFEFSTFWVEHIRCIVAAWMNLCTSFLKALVGALNDFRQYKDIFLQQQTKNVETSNLGPTLAAQQVECWRKFCSANSNERLNKYCGKRRVYHNS